MLFQCLGGGRTDKTCPYGVYFLSRGDRGKTMNRVDLIMCEKLINMW